MGKLLSIIIGLLIVAVSVGIFSGILGSDLDVYNKTIEPEYQTTFDAINKTLSDQTDLYSNIQSQGQQSEGVIEGSSDINIPKGILSAVRTSFGTIPIAKEMINATSSHIPLPMNVWSVIITILIVTITFTIMGIIINRVL